MKKEFPEFYRLEDKEIKDLWADCLFVFDANVLLNLYRYSLGTTENLIEVLKSLSDRIWIPHQFAYEYQKNRASVIEEQRIKYNKSADTISSELDKIKDLQSNYFKTSTIEDGFERYRREIPPGYCDAKEKDKDDPTRTRKFGDLIGWIQMMEKSKEVGKSVIFITSER